MKNYLLIVFAAFFITAQSLTAQGIQFEDSNWEAALAKAEKEDKIIFVDAYTTWCGPCKMMSKNTFTDEAVGKLYNAKYVNMKIDMEKGEGIDFAKKYKVRAYPTLLFIDSNGDVVHQALGYRDAAQFVSLGEAASDPNQNLMGLSKQYEAGNTDPEFIGRLLAAKSEAQAADTDEVLNGYLATQKDLNTPENRELIMNYMNDSESPYYGSFLKHQSDYAEQFGQDKVDQKKQMVVYNLLRTRTPLKPEEVKPKLEKTFGKEADLYLHMYSMYYYSRSGDTDEYISHAIAYYDNAPAVHPMELNSAAWSFYEQVDDPKQLEHALKWAQRSVELDEQYANLDTLAALHAKLGNKKEARKYAEKAIEKAKEEGQDYQETEKLLEQL